MLITRAKGVLIEAELARRGITLKRVGAELVGPCPVCGGHDRFGVNVRKQLWNCRRCDKGGDVIDLVRHLDGVTVIEAVEILTNEKLQPRRRNWTAKTETHRDGKHEQDRRALARHLWALREPLAGTITETYLREARGYSGMLPPTLGFLPARNGHAPAMIAAFALVGEACARSAGRTQQHYRRTFDEAQARRNREG